MKTTSNYSFFTIEETNAGPHFLAFFNKTDAESHFLDENPDKAWEDEEDIWEDLHWVTTINGIPDLIGWLVGSSTGPAGLPRRVRIATFLREEFPESDLGHSLTFAGAHEAKRLLADAAFEYMMDGTEDPLAEHLEEALKSL